jgi:DNA-binding MarR family transcriptional regulator
MSRVERRAEPSVPVTAQAVLDAVPPLMRAIRMHMREGRPAGISVPQFRALLYIRRRPGTDLSAVAEHLGTSLPAASELVARLVRTGLVERGPDPTSRRRMRLSLTLAGAGQLDEAQARTVAWLAERLTAADGERLAAIRGALDDLVELLSEG